MEDWYLGFPETCSSARRKFKNKDRYEVGVYTLPKKLNEEVARLHLEKIGAKLTVLSLKQADYIGVSPEYPYKQVVNFPVCPDVSPRRRAW